MRAKWHGKPYFDFTTKKWFIAFEVGEEPSVYDETKDKELNVEVRSWKKQRSLSANAYFHVLVDKIAKKSNISEVEAKNIMLSRYGFLDEDVSHVILEESIDAMKLDSIHLRPTSKIKKMDNNRFYRVHLVIRGSHTYDTAEMAMLIDGTVSEAKELGIETLPPDELERMMKSWKPSAY